jgi:PAS domain S-box-containing protein
MADVEATGSTLNKVIIRYALSLVAVAVAFLLRQALVQYIGAALPAFIFFYPVVMVVSLLGGLGPGLLATAFASLLADYWIFEPVGHFAIENPWDAIALAVFFGMGIFMSVVAERYRVYQRRAEAIKRQQALQETEAKLKKQSETQFETLANAIPQLCWMANADGWIFWYNERWYSYTGTTPQQMEGWGWQSVHDPDSLPKVLEQWQASIATGELFDMVFPLRGNDGKFRPFLTRVMPVKDADGKVVQWFGTNTDISDQKEVEADLRKNKARLDLALEVANLGEWELDLKRNTGFRSSRHAQIFGYPSYQPE